MNVVNYFHKTLHLRCLTWFWKHSWYTNIHYFHKLLRYQNHSYLKNNEQKAILLDILPYLLPFSVTSIITLQHWTEVTTSTNTKCLETKSCKWLTKKMFWKMLGCHFCFFVFVWVRDSQNNVRVMFLKQPNHNKSSLLLKKNFKFECKKILHKILHLLSLFVCYH